MLIFLKKQRILFSELTTMKSLCLIIFCLFMMDKAAAQSDVKNAQLQFDRVKSAYDTKWELLCSELKACKLANNFKMMIVAYKHEGKLEVWLKPKNVEQFSLFKTYNFAAHSGVLGPKMLEGDYQTPEGFYRINVFNPLSTYHLSLGIDYPNEVDLVRTGKTRKPGGEIYIHGNKVTVGCIPLTDDKIRELYVLALEAKANRQNEIPVYLFPFKMTETNLMHFTKQFPQHSEFWQNLKIGYDQLSTSKNVIAVKIANGKYVFK